MSTSTVDGQTDDGFTGALSPWTDALDPRGTFVTCAMALAGTVAVVVLTSSALRLVSGS